MVSSKPRVPLAPPALTPHMVLKRLGPKDDLTPGALRNRKSLPHDAVAGYAPTSRARCRQCAKSISKGDLRVVLMLQCHKGYKMPSPVHARPCLRKHREAIRLASRSEVRVDEDVKEADSKFLWESVDLLIATDSGPAGGESPEGESRKVNVRDRNAKSDEKVAKVEENNAS